MAPPAWGLGGLSVLTEHQFRHETMGQMKDSYTRTKWHSEVGVMYLGRTARAHLQCNSEVCISTRKHLQACSMGNFRGRVYIVGGIQRLISQATMELSQRLESCTFCVP